MGDDEDIGVEESLGEVEVGRELSAGRGETPQAGGVAAWPLLVKDGIQGRNQSRELRGTPRYVSTDGNLAPK